LFCVDDVDDEEDEDGCPLDEPEPPACCAIAGSASHPLNASTATEASASEPAYARMVAAVCVAARSITSTLRHF
jgi:hypothetical protein